MRLRGGRGGGSADICVTIESTSEIGWTAVVPTVPMMAPTHKSSGRPRFLQVASNLSMLLQEGGMG